MNYDFKVYFNNRKQWIDVYIEDVSPETFKSKGGGRWGYFIATWKSPVSGVLGEIHLVKSRLRLDTVAHEVFHAVIEKAWANGVVIVRRNEEAYAKLNDRLFRGIETKLKKLGLI